VLGLIDEFESNLERVLTSTAATSTSTSVGGLSSTGVGVGLAGQPMGSVRGRGFPAGDITTGVVSSTKTPLEQMSDLNRRLTSSSANTTSSAPATEESLLAQKHMEKIKERTVPFGDTIICDASDCNCSSPYHFSFVVTLLPLIDNQ
jgi:hypothetical protein